MVLGFGNWAVALTTLFVLLASIIYRAWRPRIILYRYALAQQLSNYNLSAWQGIRPITRSLRIGSLALLALVAGQLQRLDSRTQTFVKGIDIMLVLDVSGSMSAQDMDGKGSTRWDVAKREAINFVNQRPNDAIGVVIFAKEAITRCPLTLDKTILNSIIDQTHIGTIDYGGTMLSRGTLNAINRLRTSAAKSKIIVLLTDGEPSPGDASSDLVIQAAQQLGIKIYTIGVGRQDDENARRLRRIGFPTNQIDTDLLERIATQTGGQFFLATDANDMHRIYQTIDTLEKKKIKAPFVAYYTPIITPLLIGSLIGLLLELLLTTFIWFGLGVV